MNLLYLTFGPDLKNHYQAYFSILSFLNQKSLVKSINIYTDKPEFYKHLETFVNVKQVDEALLNDWKGEYDFLWRIKIKAIENLCKHYDNEPIVYLDSDTFLFNTAETLSTALQNGVSFMHEKEGSLSTLHSKTERLMWSQVKNKTFGGIKFTSNHSMWNAGVVAIPGVKNSIAIDLALKICDEMCKAGVTRRLIEQFALSVALENSFELRPAKNVIGHYWGNKPEWNQVISSFFLESHMSSLDISEELKRINAFDYKLIPVRKKVKNTKMRIQKLIEQFFPDQYSLYIQSN